MSATQRLFPLPVTASPTVPVVLGGSETPPGLRSFFGHCALFCNVSDQRHTYAPVSEHGAYCSSVNLGWVSAYDAWRRRTELYVDLVEAYYHGDYRKADLIDVRSGKPADRDAWVQLALVGDGFEPDEGVEQRGLYLPTGSARSLAAALVRAADAAEGPRGSIWRADRK